ncbi:MAG: hypothetical protein E6G41_12365 [Actinobacteria bacterium]|nr:MAG: hypothetical protein E6G41_12365 [Actinomycetota bacterium]
MTHKRLELLSTILLAVAGVATAWAAYQSRQWTGEQSLATSKATATRIAENRSAALASRQVQIDVATFTAWLNARAERHPALARFYSTRFREEFKPAFAAWLAARPLTNPSAPETPFAMPQYRLQSQTQADHLETAAAAQSDRSKDANQHADNFMLAVVLFATALFFAGISSKLQTERARAWVLGIGCVLFLGTLIWVITLPAQVST